MYRHVASHSFLLLILLLVPHYFYGKAQETIIVTNSDNIEILFSKSSAKRFILKEEINLEQYNRVISLGPDCILEFIGGTLKNGTLKGNRTKIISNCHCQIFDSVDIKGSWDVESWVPQWFGAKGDGITDDTKAIKAAHRAAYISAISGISSKEIGEMIIRLPIGRYVVTGDKIFGSVRDDVTDFSLLSVYYTLLGDNSSIIWTPQTSSSELFLFDYTIRKERISNIKVYLRNITFGPEQQTLISGKYRRLKTAGIVFRLKSDYINGAYYISSQRNSYDNVNVAPFSYEDEFVSGPDYVFYITGNCHCDMTRVSHSSFGLFRNMFYSENDQAVNWLFDHCSHSSYIKGPIYYFSRFFNDNLVIQNGEFDILSDNTTILKFKDERIKSSNSSPLPNIIFQNNRIETQKTPHDDDIIIVDTDFGHVKIENCNFILQGTNNKHIFRLSQDARLTMRDSEIKNSTILIPVYDSRTYLEGNEIADAIILDNVVHNGLSFKIWDYLSNREIKVSDVLSHRNVKFRNVRVHNLKQYGQPFPSISFSIINDCLYGGRQTPLEERSAIVECNGYTSGSVFRLPAYSMITNIDLIGYKQSTNSTGLKDIIVKQGSNKWRLPVKNIKNTICASVFNGFIGVLNDNLVNEFSFLASDDSFIQLRVSYSPYANLNEGMSEEDSIGNGYKAFAIPTSINYR